MQKLLGKNKPVPLIVKFEIDSGANIRLDVRHPASMLLNSHDSERALLLSVPRSKSESSVISTVSWPKTVTVDCQGRNEPQQWLSLFEWRWMCLQRWEH